MQLVLSSAGFYTGEIVAKTEALVGRSRSEISVAVINEGYAVEHHDNLRWVLDDLNRIRDNFGGSLELINLLALDTATVRERVLEHDVIFVVGGHTDYLMSVFRKTGFAALLPELLATKVYVGSSAGSMVLGQRVSTEAYAAIYGDGDTYEVDSYMNVVDFAIKPHLNSSHFVNNRVEKLLEVSREFRGTLYGLPDESAVIVDGDAISILGKAAVKIVNGSLIGNE